MKWLQEQVSSEKEQRKIVHVAADGETPGWDIEDRRTKHIVAYEVKGTSGAMFPSIQVTANEWKSAQKFGDRYNLVLVARCESKTPLIEVINDPWRQFSAGKLVAEPTEFRIERVEI
jgi:hypothetical protein